MAVEADMKEVSVSSLKTDSLEASGDVISAEDWAWVDSCLIQDGEISDSSWNSLKDALLDILSDQPASVDSLAAHSERVPDEYDIEILPSSEEVETAEFPVSVDEEMENDRDDVKVDNNNLHSQTFVGNPFLPNYNEGMTESKNNKSGLDSGISMSDKEPSTSDIFKVWDLNFPVEEDEFGKQLNKAFTESSVQSMPSTVDDSVIWKDVEIESLDDLIASIADLSLKQNSN